MSVDFAVLEAVESTPEPRATYERPSGFVRRLPVGAEPQLRGRRAFSRLGAARSRDRRRNRRLLPDRAGCRGGRLFLGPDRRRAARHALWLSHETSGEAAARSGLAFSAGRTARAIGNRRSRGVPLDRPGLARPQREELVIYEMHVGTFTPEGSWEAAAREAARAGRARHHLHRADAGRRFSRPLRLGL